MCDTDGASASVGPSVGVPILGLPVVKGAAVPSTSPSVSEKENFIERFMQIDDEQSAVAFVDSVWNQKQKRKQDPESSSQLMSDEFQKVGKQLFHGGNRWKPKFTMSTLVERMIQSLKTDDSLRDTLNKAQRASGLLKRALTDSLDGGAQQGFAYLKYLFDDSKGKGSAWCDRTRWLWQMLRPRHEGGLAVENQKLIAALHNATNLQQSLEWLSAEVHHPAGARVNDEKQQNHFDQHEIDRFTALLLQARVDVKDRLVFNQGYPIDRESTEYNMMCDMKRRQMDSYAREEEEFLKRACHRPYQTGVAERSSVATALNKCEDEEEEECQEDDLEKMKEFVVFEEDGLSCEESGEDEQDGLSCEESGEDEPEGEEFVVFERDGLPCEESGEDEPEGEEIEATLPAFYRDPELREIIYDDQIANTRFLIAKAQNKHRLWMRRHEHIPDLKKSLDDMFQACGDLKEMLSDLCRRVRYANASTEPSCHCFLCFLATDADNHKLGSCPKCLNAQHYKCSRFWKDGESEQPPDDDDKWICDECIVAADPTPP